jgi:hypothetical protein
VATLRSITIIITIRTTISTATSLVKGKVIGSTTRNIEGTLLTVTGEQQTGLGQTIGSSQALVVQAAVRARVIAQGAGLVLAIVPLAELVLAIVPVAELVLETARVVALEPEIDPVAAEPESPAVPVALELETVLVAVERELDQVAVVLVRDHLRARLALPVKTKSVTTAHRLDLVPLLAEAEDLVVAAQTTREPVAAEAAIAWAAAE